ncbi:hypothetical protein C8Q76DRAFT_721938 [Earliella scabrosa]|nr:hypothetical protein C8Q76DRAFT_721938 [Earliella scabrosa]
MTSRHSQYHAGTVGRLSSAKFDQSAPTSLMSQRHLPPLRDIPSPQSDSSTSPPTTPRCMTPPQTTSLLERHAISSYPAKKTQLPLSVYELPTATYMWPRWNPREGEQPSRNPVIFVKYRPAQCDVESSSGYSRSPSRSSILTSSSHPSPASTPPPAFNPRKRSSSAESGHESVGSPSDRFLKHPRVSHHNAPSRVISDRSASPPGRAIPVFPRCESGQSPSAPRGVGADSDYSDVEMASESYTHPAHQSNSARSATPARSVAPDAAPALAALRVNREEDPRRNEWMRYTMPPPDTTAAPEYDCIWEVKLRDGTTKPCGYHSKKHLVKRHIESKHLQLRPCVCRYCGKGFAQKSNLDTHLNTHTGEAPHKCNYCEERFKDPARRHRHMIQSHNHQSSRSKKDKVFPDGGAASLAETSDPDAE